jgi:diaminopimelate decarboxylase
MHDFRYVEGKLFCEGVAVETLAGKFGTPLYVYSARTLADHYGKLDAALSPVDHLICYAVKANSNLAILRLLKQLGSGFDVVSAGELQRVIAAGGDPRHCVFAGVGKLSAEIEFALKQGIYSLNVESEAELARINEIARRIRVVAPVAIRANPDVAAGTHAKITTGTYQNKFGIAYESLEAVYARARRLKHIRLRGVQMHIGSQLTQVGPFAQAVTKMVPLVRRLQEQYELEFFSIGGGIGVIYQDALASGSANWWKTTGRHILTPQTYAQTLLPQLQPLNLRILVEPGRFIVANAGILLTRVEYVKNTGRKHFAIVDAAMNDLIRPALYDAYHEIVPIRRRRGGKRSLQPTDVVGPICESSDFFCHDRPLPRLGANEYVAVLSAGAYGFTMASNYNSRPMAAEVLVRGNKAALIRKRQATAALWAEEQIPGWV